MTEITLAQLKIGQKALITSMASLPPQSRQKLLDMGLTRGEEIVMIHKAPLGDPLWLAVRGYELSFRKELAQHIMVEPIAQPPSSNAQQKAGGAQEAQA